MGHGHPHDHEHEHAAAADVPPALDLSVPDRELSPSDVSRRGFLRGAGLLGAGAAASVLSTPQAAHASGNGPAESSAVGGFRWLAGDHHIHTQYSSDGQYRAIDQARHGRAYGLDWLVITDHGSEAHARIGVAKVNPDILATRRELPDLLTFQGLEWNIPAAEHATVFVHPGRHEVDVLQQFERTYDGSQQPATNTEAQNEATAVAGIRFLGEQVRRRKVDAALMLANHPSRRGIDSPHEIRNWRDADPSVAIGMEGAPGHQAGGIPAPDGRGGARGLYDNNPAPASYAGYPLETYRTWGGFDWMTATVGGLWDSLLAEGRPWWVTVSSDSHVVYLDQSQRGPGDFAANGRYDDPVYTGKVNTTASDFWPGYYGRTNVGAASFSYRSVMDGLRAGRVWVDHGRLVKGLDVRVRQQGDRRASTGTPLGGVLHARRGTATELTIDIDLQDVPNWAQLIPVLRRVDVIVGQVTGPVGDRDTFTAPQTTVVKSFEVTTGAAGRLSLSLPLGRLDTPFHVRVRGTDGNRSQPGLRGSAVDPHGPQLDVLGAADPWTDLWLYTNPIWVLPR